MDNASENDLSLETLTTAPPAPQEVKVRTMASDLASMAASGGGLPQYHSVRITGIAAARDPQKTARKTSLLVAIICIAGVLVVLVLGYFGYWVFQAKAVPAAANGSGVGQ